MNRQWEKRKEFRRSIFERAQNRCESCGNEGVTLQLHHTTYRRYNKEHPEDFEVLCFKCHGSRHAYHPNIDGIDPHGIREMRRLLGVSQVALATYLGVGEETVGAWEKGSMPQTRYRKALHRLAKKKKIPAHTLKISTGEL